MVDALKFSKTEDPQDGLWLNTEGPHVPGSNPGPATKPGSTPGRLPRSGEKGAWFDSR